MRVPSLGGEDPLERKCNPLQDSCLGNSEHRGSWRATVHGVVKESRHNLVTATAKSLQSYPTVRPHRRQPTRLPRPWDPPGKNTGVGCHCLLQCMKVKSESEVAQSCLTLSDLLDCSLPGSSVHGIFQVRVLEWVAIAFSILEQRLYFL